MNTVFLLAFLATDAPLHEKRRMFLDIGISYYVEKPSERRSMKYNVCSYRGAGGTKCFIGWFLTDEQIAAHPTQCVNLTVHAQEVFDMLPENIRNLGKGFLGACQRLHDREGHWDVGYFSPRGWQEYQGIVNSYCQPDSKL